MNKNSLCVGRLAGFSLWTAAIVVFGTFLPGSGVSWAQDSTEFLFEDSTFSVDPASPVEDNQPQYNVRKSLLSGNPPVRPFDPKRPLILSAQKCLARHGSGYADARYLMIQYPWSRIKGSSVEIRVLDEKVKEKPIWCVPVYFNEVYRKHQRVNDLLYQIRLTDGPRTFGSQYFSKEFMNNELLPESEMQIISFGTLLDKKGVLAYIKKENRNTNLEETTLSYPELSDWSANDNTLFLELRGDEFDDNCDIRVWLVKDATVIWEEDFVWPGNLKEAELKAKADRNKKIASSIEAEKANEKEESN